MLIAEAPRFPELADRYHEEILRPCLDMLRQAIQRGIDRGEIRKSSIVEFAAGRDRADRAGRSVDDDVRRPPAARSEGLFRRPPRSGAQRLVGESSRARSLNRPARHCTALRRGCIIWRGSYCSDAASRNQGAAPMHDIVIRGGTIVDGTGKAPFSGDVAIDGRPHRRRRRQAGPGQARDRRQGAYWSRPAGSTCTPITTARRCGIR